MKSDLFTNLVANYNVYQISAVEIDGVTWLKPLEKIENSFSVMYNALAVVDEILVDFFRIGKFIDKNINKDDYMPLFYEEGILRESRFNKESIEINKNYLQDANSPILKNNKDQITAYIIEFLNRYGFLGYQNRFISDQIVENIVIHKFGKESYQSTCPLSWAVYKIYETYLKYKNPDKYIQLCKKNVYTHNYIEKDKNSINIKISLNVSYTSNGWLEKKHVWTLLDLISLFLFYNENKFIRECPCCSDFFVTTTEKAIYCSPICRNRYNTKKSYNKKKMIKNADNTETR